MILNRNPYHPEVYRTYVKPKAPTKHQMAKNLIALAKLDLNSDWSVYHAMITALLTQSHVEVKDSYDDEATEVFNALKVPYDSAIKFLETYTETYFAIEDESIDLNDLNEKNFYQAGL